MRPQISDLPPLFGSADAASNAGQRRYLWATRIRLGLAVVAAAFAAVGATGKPGDVSVIALVAAFAFIGALLVEASLARWEFETTWYDGRAVAESVKTVAWRFAVGGLPYARSSDDSEGRLNREIGLLLEDSPKETILQKPGEVVTRWMRDLRATDLAGRKDTYLAYRVDDQLQWYHDKAAFNRRRGRQLRGVLIVLNLLGAIAALGTAFGGPQIDLAGVFSGAVGAVAAWLAVKQHDALWRAYTQAAHEMELVRQSLADIEDETEWAAAISDAEEAVSREHTMWRARRVVAR